MSRDDLGVVFRDLLLGALLAIVAVLILILPWIAEPQKRDEGEEPTGNVLIHITWPGLDVDIDLWVQAPGDVPIGYSNLNGLFFNLLRDDLGFLYDKTGVNYEDAMTRGIPYGEYTINLHMFANRANSYPIPVTTTVSVWTGEGKAKQLLRSQSDLGFIGQEVTVFRFTLLPDGSLVPDSVHAIPKPLRAAMYGSPSLGTPPP